LRETIQEKEKKTGWISFPFLIDLVTQAVANFSDFAQVVGNNGGESYVHGCTDNPGKSLVLLEEAFKEEDLESGHSKFNSGEKEGAGDNLFHERIAFL
jgi:hypothetical protein